MEALGQMVIAAAELIEAEGRSIRIHILRLSAAIGLVIVAVLLGLVGTGFAIFGLFTVLSGHMSGPAAATGVGLVAFVLAGGIGWCAHQMIR